MSFFFYSFYPTWWIWNLTSNTLSWLTKLFSLFHTLVSHLLGSTTLQALSSWDFTPGHLFFGGALQFVHSLSVRIGGPSSLVHRPFLSSPCVPCFLQFARFPSHFSRECEEKSNETKRFLPNRLRKCKNDSFFAHPSIRQRIQVRFYHSFFDTHSGFCFGFELLFWFAKNLGFEFCGLMIFMWAPCICEASSERNRSWVCEEGTRLWSSCHFSLLMTVSFL